MRGGHASSPATTTPSPSKKRKAAALLDEPALDSPEPTSPQSNAQSRRFTSKSTATPDEVPFRVQCPARPTKSRRAEDVYRARDAPGVAGLEVDYAIRPGARWSQMRSYRNVRLIGQTFTTGDIIYVNRHHPTPEPPAENAPDAEVLAYDRANTWVARIADTRAESDKAVFIRVFWLYWPEELPMGRQAHHGERELVMSNAIDIIEAVTISCAAKVSFWDEADEESDAKLHERFWRQTLDITKLGKRQKGGLGRVRTHCICQQPYNPDTTMYKCRQESCATWNHEACLVDSLLDAAWTMHEQGTMHEALDRQHAASIAEATDKRSLGEKLLSPAERLGALVKRTFLTTSDHAEDGVEAAHDEQIRKDKPASPVNSKTKSKTKTKTKSSTGAATKPWNGLLTATLSITDEDSGRGIVKATIREVEELNSSGPDAKRMKEEAIDDTGVGVDMETKNGKKAKTWEVACRV